MHVHVHMQVVNGPWTHTHARTLTHVHGMHVHVHMQVVNGPSHEGANNSILPSDVTPSPLALPPFVENSQVCECVLLNLSVFVSTLYSQVVCVKSKGCQKQPSLAPLPLPLPLLVENCQVCVVLCACVYVCKHVGR
jgi:hypothetical protein